MRRLSLAALLIAAPAAAEDKKPDIRAKLEGHRGGVTAVAFSVKGDLIATGSGNGMVRVWDAKTGKLLAKTNDHRANRVTSVAFSGDGKLLSAAAKTDFVVWDVATPAKPAVAFKESNPKADACIGTVSGNGKRFYFAFNFAKADGKPLEWEQLRYHDPEAKTTTKSEPYYYWRYHALAAIPDEDSDMLVTWESHTEVDADRARKYSLRRHGAAVQGEVFGDVTKDDRWASVPAFSPDGRWLYANGGVWRVPGSHAIPYGGPTISTKGGSIAAPGPGDVLAYPPPAKPSTVVVIKLNPDKDPETLAEFATGIETPSCLAFSPDGKTLAVGNEAEGVVELWTIAAK